MTLPHTFADPALREQALTHPSMASLQPDIAHNQRMEFLGDAVVGMIVTELVYRAFPGWDEGAMTRARSALVKTETFARFAEELGLVAALRVASPDALTARKVRADAFEAMVAAVWLDAQATGGDRAAWAAARAFVEPLLVPLVKAIPADAPPTDPVSALQHRVQAAVGTTPTYEVTDVEGEAHERTYVVYVRADGRSYGPGRGRTKRAASAAAATLALAALDGADPAPG
jgi:ribonuclease-3